MKFRFYITNLFDGCVEGTNDEARVNDLSACEEYFVVDSDAGLWLTTEGPVDIKEQA